MQNAKEAVLTDERWEAITQCDKAYDGRFFYAVMTTGIFCRPSCKSRTPSKEHVRIFMDADSALSAKFRPCKRCKPDGRQQPMEEWVGQAARLIETRYTESLTLGRLAENVHGSPYHLQRTFNRVMGVSPAEYLLQTRIAAAKRLLIDPHRPIADIAASVGLPNPGHFTTSFRKTTGQTPTEYRQSIAAVRSGQENNG